MPTALGRWLQRLSLLLSALWITLLGALAIGLSTAQPWVGLHLRAVGDAVEVAGVDAGSPAAAAGVQAGMRLVAVSSAAAPAPLWLEPADLVENPDLLPDYAAWARFYARQTVLSQLWAGPSLRLHVQELGQPEARLIALRPAPGRLLRALPATFWFLLGVQAVILLAVAWGLVVFRPEPAMAYVCLAALLFSVALGCAAVFTGRELALPAGLFHALSVVTHTTALGALLSLSGLLAHFPNGLPPLPKWVVAVGLALFAGWALANAAWWLPSPNWACRAMLVCALGLVWLQGLRQWRLGADNPDARRALRVLVLPWMLALTLLVGWQKGVLLLGGTPAMGQPWLYGVLAVATVFSVLGMYGFRRFDLNDWALQALLSLGAGIAALLCYQIVLVLPGVRNELAVPLAVVMLGLTYVPLSSLVWARSVRRRGPNARELTGGILALGFAPLGARERHWQDLLCRTLQVRQLDTEAPRGVDLLRVKGPALVSNGRGLWVPPVADLPGAMLWSRNRGGRLFSTSDRRLAQRLLELVAQTIQTRDAYVRGAADERERIADDLHDDLGARLLSLVRAGERSDPAVAALAREALDEMRLSVRNLKGQAVPVTEVLADWRAETVGRLATAGIRANWHAYCADESLQMPVRTRAHITRVLREAISNVIRHSGSGHCRIRVEADERALRLEVEDRGRGLVAAGMRPPTGTGLGLLNIERRVHRLRGSHRFANGPRGGTLLTVQVPLRA